MTSKQRARADYLIREAGKIAREARESHQRGEFERVIRKTNEAVELWLKGKLLEKGIEPAKIHDLNELDRRLATRSGISEEDLLFLTSERIPSFYGAEDLIPDEAYDTEDAERCLLALQTIGI